MFWFPYRFHPAFPLLTFMPFLIVVFQYFFFAVQPHSLLAALLIVVAGWCSIFYFLFSQGLSSPHSNASVRTLTAISFPYITTITVVIIIISE